MITPKQKWALGGLITLSAAIWTPQIMERVSGGTSAQAGVAAGPAEDEMLRIEMETSGAGGAMASATGVPVREVRPLTPTPAQEGAEMDPGGAPNAPVGSQAIVSEVLRTLRQSEAFSVAESPMPQPVAHGVGEVFQEPESPPELFKFVQANPLRGTIAGETVRVALIGPYRVHLGETVPGTGAVLVEVERGLVVLEDGAVRIELELEPLKTSSALMAERSRQSQNAATGGAVGLGGGGVLPGSTDSGTPPGPIPAAEAAARMNQESNNGPSDLPGDF